MTALKHDEQKMGACFRQQGCSMTDSVHVISLKCAVHYLLVTGERERAPPHQEKSGEVR